MKYKQPQQNEHEVGSDGKSFLFSIPKYVMDQEFSSFLPLLLK